jgi:outer membrane murein-binding lipoprotein Lpp
MAFTVRDFQGLVRALERRAEWKAELRRLLLTDELLSLPRVVRELAEEVRELAAGQARLAASHERLAEEVRELAAGLARLAASHERLTEEVRTLVAAQQLTEGRLGRLEGSDLERRYRERAAGFFQRVLSRIRLVDHQELGLLLDDAVEAGTLSPEDKAEILLADVVVQGRRDQQEAYVLAEVSAVVDPEDVRRAAARARLLERAVGVPVLAAVAGQRATPEAAEGARAAGVWRLLDGRVEEPPDRQ